jgi:hypothetical protein
MSWAVSIGRTTTMFATAIIIAITGADTARASVPPVEKGGVTHRSTTRGNLTAEDRRRFRELGLVRPHSAVVIMRKIPKSEDGRQYARLRALAQAPERFAPSGACDELRAEGEARALCLGHVAGPLGSVAVRMPIAATLSEGAGGALELVLRNPRPLEVKGLFSWSSVVAAQHMVIAYDLLPDPHGWLVYVRIGVEMNAHEDSATTLSDTMEKVEAWLSRDLATL